VLKEQRGMRRFRMQGLEKVKVEWTLASIAYNLTRIWRSSQPLRGAKQSSPRAPQSRIRLFPAPRPPQK
jgi:Transposase DDE domain